MIGPGAALRVLARTRIGRLLLPQPFPHRARPRRAQREVSVGSRSDRGRRRSPPQSSDGRVGRTRPSDPPLVARNRDLSLWRIARADSQTTSARGRHPATATQPGTRQGGEPITGGVRGSGEVRGREQPWGSLAGVTGVASKVHSHGGWAPPAGSGEAMFLATARSFFGQGAVRRCVGPACARHMDLGRRRARPMRPSPDESGDSP